jgi:acyl carrier protein
VNRTDASELFGKLQHGIAPEVDLAGTDPDAMLQETLDLDSMDFLNLVTALHDTTGVEVPEQDYPRLATVRGFVDYIAEVAP